MSSNQSLRALSAAPWASLCCDVISMRCFSFSNKKRTPLSSVAFELTPHCNLQCRYCYNIWKRPGHSASFMPSYKYAKKTLERLFRQANIRNVTMTGGEPFLSERFFELVLFCRMRKKNVSIITNGNAATKQDYKIIHGFGVNLFEIPLHASRPEPHDWMTKAKGSWNKAKMSIESVLQIGALPVVVVVLTKANAPEIKNTLEFIAHLGVQRVMLNRFNIGGQGIEEAQDLALSICELRAAFDVANQAAFEHGLQITSNVCTPMCVLDPRDYPKIGFSSCGSEPDRMPVTVNAVGDVRLCNHSPVVLGNIFDITLDEMFSSEYVKGWKNIVPKICSDCSLFAKCRSGCRAACEQIGTSLHQVDPVLPVRGNAAQYQTRQIA